MPEISRKNNERSLAAFRERHSLSKSKFYALVRRKQGPKITWINGIGFVSEKDEAAYDRALENPPPARLRLLKREAEARTRRAKAAGLASAKARRLPK